MSDTTLRADETTTSDDCADTERSPSSFFGDAEDDYGIPGIDDEIEADLEARATHFDDDPDPYAGTYGEDFGPDDYLAFDE